MNTPDSAIQHVLLCFDFQKVHSVMCATNWYWKRGGVPYIPDVLEIKLTAANLLRGAMSTGQQKTFGGLVAHYRWTLLRGNVLTLSFEIARTSSTNC